MNRINIDNYEAYLLDFSEGNLSGELQVELELFLIQHPELNINLSDLSLVSIESESLSFNKKGDLKKTESDLVSETQFIAYIEDQLPLKEKTDLEKGCANNESLAKELNLYKHTITTADATIVFPYKNKIKRQTKVIWFNFSATQYSIAASVLLLLGMYVFWPKADLTGVSADSLAFDIRSNTNVEVKSNAIALVNENTNKVLNNNKTNSSKEDKPVKSKQKHTIQIANNHVSSQKEETNHDPLTNLTTTVNLAKVEPNVNKEENVVSPRSKTVVEVITENDDELAGATISKKKKGLWAFAERTLKNLNTVGVKAVNGQEESGANDNSYALTLGGMSITHKSN